jgi:hypothetical protein
MITLHPQYIKDANGQKTLVILPVKEFDSLMEALEDSEDIKLYDEAKKEDSGERILFSDNAKKRKPKKAPDIYQIQISLNEHTPKIWRQIQLKSDTLLSDLHKIIQTTMGWTNSHLHQFMKDGECYSEPSPGDEELERIDYLKIKLSAMLKKEKDTFMYEYDFGDGWEHTIILEKILPVDLKTKYPVCLDGKMKCPPEDCGGVSGFKDMLKILKNKNHEEYQSYIVWLGGEFNPKEFDLVKINKILRKRDFGCIELF